MSKALNAALIEGLDKDLGTADSCVLVGTVGMTVAEVSELRRRLRERSFRMRVVRNSLAARTFQRRGWNGLGECLAGLSAVVYGGEGALSISKALVEEKRTYKDKLVIHGGWSEGEVIDAAGIDALSRIPGRSELLGLVLGGMAGPLTGFAAVLDGLFTEMHGLIEALRDRAEKAGGAA
jgi:large subunit ribosomal protein L10